MLTYKLKEIKDHVKYYEYYPEGDKSECGIIAFDLDGGIDIIQDSKVDVKRYYAIHAVDGIDTSEDSGMVAWY